jgi:hypothetical protein
MLYGKGIEIDEPWFRKFNHLSYKHNIISLRAHYGVVPMRIDVWTGARHRGDISAMEVRVMVLDHAFPVWGITVYQDGFVGFNQFDVQMVLFGGTRRKPL